MVVDDNSTSRRILTEMLNNWGMHPHAAPTVAEGLAELERSFSIGQPYALILTDSNMPGQDGFELARQIQLRRELCGAMIMMLTSADRSDDSTRCQQLSISAYLIKPVKQSELLDAIVQAVGATTQFAGSAIESAPPSRVASKSKSILLAEDSLINQKLAIGLLERWGHTVTVANNGVEAVKLSGDRRFDLILMDVQMPELDGLDATRQIRFREIKSGGHLPIIAMTAHAMKGDKELCLSAGMDGYLMKPIRAEQLFRQIEEVSSQSGVHAAVSIPAGKPVPPSTESISPEAANPVSATVSAAAEPLVDWKVASRAVNGDQRLLEQVMAAFLSEGPQLLQTMQTTYGGGDHKRFQRAAHTLKSALRTFGVAAASSVEELEMSAKDGLQAINSNEVSSVIGTVTPVFQEMEDRLRSMRTNGTI
jgi:CheY-like chemotaxis protein